MLSCGRLNVNICTGDWGRGKREGDVGVGKGVTGMSG